MSQMPAMIVNEIPIHDHGQIGQLLLDNG